MQANSQLTTETSEPTSRVSRINPGVTDFEPVIQIDLDKEKVRSHIAEGDEFIGDLKCATGVRISGKVQGSVTCATGAVVIEKSGFVSGSISGQEKVFIDGRVGAEDSQEKVKITSPGMIVLMNDANVNADLEYGKLATYGDMTHNGSSRKIQTNR